MPRMAFPAGTMALLTAALLASGAAQGLVAGLEPERLHPVVAAAGLGRWALLDGSASCDLLPTNVDILFRNPDRAIVHFYWENPREPEAFGPLYDLTREYLIRNGVSPPLPDLGPALDDLSPCAVGRGSLFLGTLFYSVYPLENPPFDLAFVPACVGTPSTGVLCEGKGISMFEEPFDYTFRIGPYLGPGTVMAVEFVDRIEGSRFTADVVAAAADPSHSVPGLPVAPPVDTGEGPVAVSPSGDAHGTPTCLPGAPACAPGAAVAIDGDARGTVALSLLGDARGDLVCRHVDRIGNLCASVGVGLGGDGSGAIAVGREDANGDFNAGFPVAISLLGRGYGFAAISVLGDASSPYPLAVAPMGDAEVWQQNTGATEVGCAELGTCALRNLIPL